MAIRAEGKILCESLTPLDELIKIIQENVIKYGSFKINTHDLEDKKIDFGAMGTQLNKLEYKYKYNYTFCGHHCDYNCCYTKGHFDCFTIEDKYRYVYDSYYCGHECDDSCGNGEWLHVYDSGHKCDDSCENGEWSHVSNID